MYKAIYCNNHRNDQGIFVYIDYTFISGIWVMQDILVYLYLIDTVPDTSVLIIILTKLSVLLEYQDQENSSPLHDTTMDDNTSAATSGGNEDEEICKIAEMLSRIPPPQVCDIGPRDALVQWQPFDCSEASASGGPFPQIDASEFTYEILLYERRPEGKPTSNYRCQADQLQQQWLANLKPSTEYFVR